jgi:hypothetical protein
MLRICAAHFRVIADCLALLSEGINIAINSAMIPMTTSNSTSVKPRGDCRPLT